MSFFGKVLGIVTGKAALMERVQRFEKEGKPALVRQMVYLRMAKEQAVPIDFDAFGAEVAGNLAQHKLQQIERLLTSLSDAELRGTPEATIVVTVQLFWTLKKSSNRSELEILRKIENRRAVLGGPRGGAVPGTDLATFLIWVIRSENPECTPEKIGDDTIRALVDMALDSVKEVYDFLPDHPA